MVGKEVVHMFIHPFDRESHERDSLARRDPGAYDALIESEQEQRRKSSERPDILDRLIVWIGRLFRRNQ